MTQKQSVAVLVLAAACLAQSANAQSTESKAQKTQPNQVQTFFLKNVTSTNDLNDVQTVLRNALPGARIYGSAATRSITVSASDEDMGSTQKLLSDLDRPNQSYRVTYTISDVDGGKRSNSQHYSLVVVGNNSSEFRQGNRVPIITGRNNEEKSGEQVQYVDVGVNIKCTAEPTVLHSKVEVSTVADEKSTVGIQDPVIHQTLVEGYSLITPGKPQIIGTIEVPGANRRQEIEVSVEPLH